MESARAALPQVPERWRAIATAAGPVENGWVRAFDDPRLLALVEEAQARSTDLQTAVANVQQARAMAAIARAGLYPTLSASAAMTASRIELDLEGLTDGIGMDAAQLPSSITSEGVGANLGASASWEVDLWGRIRDGYYAELENLAAARADFRGAQQSVAASVTQAYLTTIEAAAQQELAEETVETAATLYRLVSLQVEVGEIAAAERALARAELASARNGLAQAVRSRRQAIRALEVLLGRYPAAELGNGAYFPEVPRPPGASVPAALLERRPDLYAAERRVAAALYREEQADKASLPSLSLTGMIQLISQTLDGIFDPAATLLSAGPGLNVPLFSGWEEVAQAELADARVRSAVANYESVALQAFREVENSLDRGATLRLRHEELTIRVEQLERRYEVELLRYRYGESSLLDVTQIRQRYLTARTDLVQVERALRDQFIELNLALGGWWAESVEPIGSIVLTEQDQGS
ncbi:NodT family efflux transporter outer membrane factor (OMF) lipoprotein [Pacificimonas flava]|nr:NodT family efflux transporter outer membrane factor (OMF) lipoprotein [Pacificimonas flava]